MTSTQKKILIMVGAALLTFFVCWFWMYVPARKKIQGLKEELRLTTDKITDIEGVVGAVAQDSSSGIVKLKARADYLDTRFPDQEETSLTLLSDLAQDAAVTILSLQTSPKQVYGGNGAIGGRTCRRVEVSMELVGAFQNILHYLKMLKKDLPAMITIETLNLKKRGSGTGQLDVSITLNIYLLS